MGEIKSFWLDKKNCTGCGACANICPKNAITMHVDSMGFMYPVINDSCINCNLCEKICNERLSLTNQHPLRVYACWSKDTENRFYSTSGGLVGEIVAPILKAGGYVIGAAYDEDNLVEHISIHSINDLKKIQQSKYLQSDSKKIYKETKELLDCGQKVAFTGTPCQIAALKAYLRHDYENLLTIDFICRGVNSPKAYQAWLKEIEEKYLSKITSVWFKYKVGGWKSSPKRTKLHFDNGKDLVLEGNDNLYMSGYLGPNLYIRPSCGNCAFKGSERNSDLTVADFWGIEKEFDDDKGTSMVMLNSLKGKAAWNDMIDNIQYAEKDVQEAINGNPCFRESVSINPNSELFLKMLDNTSFSKALSKFYKKPIFLLRAIGRAKHFVKKILGN